MYTGSKERRRSSGTALTGPVGSWTIGAVITKIAGPKMVTITVKPPMSSSTSAMPIFTSAGMLVASNTAVGRILRR